MRVSDLSDLAAQRCVPCRGGVAPLAAPEIDRLLTQVPRWALRDGPRIERRITCRAFADALALVNQIGALAESEGHHPDVAFGWGYVGLSLQTKVLKGLHANDFILAAKVDKLLEKWSAET